MSRSNNSGVTSPIVRE